MRRLLRFYHLFLVLMLGILCISLMIPVGMQILARYGEIIPAYLWTEEAARFNLIWLIMVGSAVAVRENAHFDIDLLPTPRTAFGALVAQLFVRLCVLGFALTFLWGSVSYTKFGMRMTSDMSDINMAYVYSAFPFAAIGWVAFTLESIYDAVAGYLRAESAPVLKEAENGAR
ncbi:TRAP transporter small permease [Ancylobacter mangrovi]|uniref:TRAP transporter small permease n=1 Tax=Ancylobacter mangrovi TaxID=2972472 RepID=UPI0021611963|nr:TRAP transporter small permease [Ancylobacter mangrovi]MCS0503352.1 TRAP transporter small permease [Ancylobacter mangrovi]